MIRYKIIIRGDVQGVGFRYFSYHEAISHRITGWVRNCYDNSVEIEAQGNVEDLDKYLTSLSYSNGFAFVENLFKEKIGTIVNEKSIRISM